jgi:hypothetical protein
MVLLHYTSSAEKHITICPEMRENDNETELFARILGMDVDVETAVCDCFRSTYPNPYRFGADVPKRGGNRRYNRILASGKHGSLVLSGVKPLPTTEPSQDTEIFRGFSQ